jgi:hypothetical protein
MLLRYSSFSNLPLLMSLPPHVCDGGRAATRSARRVSSSKEDSMLLSGIVNIFVICLVCHLSAAAKAYRLPHHSTANPASLLNMHVEHTELNRFNLKTFIGHTPAQYEWSTLVKQVKFIEVSVKGVKF